MKSDMGRAWSDATAPLSANRQVVLIVAGVFFFLPYLAVMLLLPDSFTGVPAGRQDDPDAAFAAMSALYADNWWVILLLAVFQGIGMLGLLALLTDRSRPTVGEALGQGAKSFLPYLAAQILQGLVIVVAVVVPITLAAATGSTAVTALVALVAMVLVAYLLTKFSLTIPVIAIGRVMNPVRALARSWALTKGNSVRLFFFYVLLVLVVIVVAIVLGMIIALASVLAGPDGSLIANGLISAIINMAAVTLALAVLAAIYRQLAGPSTESLNETFS